MISPKTQALPKKEIDKVEKHVFRVYDTNGDGFIDFVEFMVLFHILSEGSPNEVLSKIFRVFDVNSDGSITQKEMQRLVTDLFGLIQIQHNDQSQAINYLSDFRRYPKFRSVRSTLLTKPSPKWMSTKTGRLQSGLKSFWCR